MGRNRRRARDRRAAASAQRAQHDARAAATAGTTLQYAGYAIVLIVVLLFLPDGIVPSIQKAWRRRTARA
jgi:ABC-type branched-subunit amino acid transport system permease subunit